MKNIFILLLICFPSYILLAQNPFIGIWDITESANDTAVDWHGGGFAFNDSTMFAWVGFGGGLFPKEIDSTKVKYSFTDGLLFFYEKGNTVDSCRYKFQKTALTLYYPTDTLFFVKWK